MPQPKKDDSLVLPRQAWHHFRFAQVGPNSWALMCEQEKEKDSRKRHMPSPAQLLFQIENKIIHKTVSRERAIHFTSVCLKLPNLLVLVLVL